MLKHFSLAAALSLGTFSASWAADAATTMKIAIDGLTASDKVEAKVKTLVSEELAAICKDPKVVAAVKAQNAKGMSLDDIKKHDDAWKNAEDILPIQEEKLTNDLAAHLTAALEGKPLAECFVTDNQGANVGQTALTGDFWQGDEAKWKNSYAGGKGGIDIGDVELDESSGEVLQQISLPVVDADGTVVGAATFGIVVSNVK